MSLYGNGDRFHPAPRWGCALVLSEEMILVPSLYLSLCLFPCGSHGLGHSSCEWLWSSLSSQGQTGAWVSSGCAPCSTQGWAQRLCLLFLQMPMKPLEVGVRLPRTNLPLHQSQ